MKKIILILIIFLCHLPAPAQQTQNYVLSSAVNNSGAMQSVYHYYDASGRPFERVEVGITPSHSNLAWLSDYDGLGRPSRDWLPATVSAAYVQPSTLRSTGYSAYSDTRPFAETLYDGSPLNRETAAKGTGQQWTAHYRSTDYLINTDTFPLSCRNYYEQTNRKSMRAFLYIVILLFSFQQNGEAQQFQYELPDGRKSIYALDTIYIRKPRLLLLHDSGYKILVSDSILQNTYIKYSWINEYILDNKDCYFYQNLLWLFFRLLPGFPDDDFKFIFEDVHTHIPYNRRAMRIRYDTIAEYKKNNYSVAVLNPEPDAYQLLLIRGQELRNAVYGNSGCDEFYNRYLKLKNPLDYVLVTMPIYFDIDSVFPLPKENKKIKVSIPLRSSPGIIEMNPTNIPNSISDSIQWPIISK